MKIFVTGATGFVGSHLTEWLAAQGHEVWGLYRSPAKRELMSVPGTGVRGALSTDPRQCNAWISELPDDLDAVAHVAGLTHSFRPSDFSQVNAVGARRLVLDLRERFPRLRFLLVSSLAAAGPSLQGRDESQPPQPVSDYGRSKLEAEQALVEMAPAGWELAIVRPPMVIGPRDPAMLDMFKMVKSRLIIMPGWASRGKPFSFVGIDDLVNVLGQCLIQSLKRRPAVYFPAFPEPVPFGGLIQAIRDVMNVRTALSLPAPVTAMQMVALVGKAMWFCGLPAARLTPDKVREASQQGWVCRSHQTIEDLGIRYEHDLPTVLTATLHDYRQRGWM